jgi:hypothetical protein
MPISETPVAIVDEEAVCGCRGIVTLPDEVLLPQLECAGHLDGRYQAHEYLAGIFRQGLHDVQSHFAQAEIAFESVSALDAARIRSVRVGGFRRRISRAGVPRFERFGIEA